MDTPDAPLPEGNVPLDDLIEELGMDPADFERTPAQEAAVARIHASSDRLSERGQPRQCWVLYDFDQVVSVHRSEQGAQAARLAHQDHARTTMGDAWNPSYDEAVEVLAFDLME
jgi:hypothetical protein